MIPALRVTVGLIAALVFAPSAAWATPRALADAQAAHDRGDRRAEGAALMAVLDDPHQASAHADAQVMLGDLYLTAELPEAALLSWTAAAAQSPALLADRLGTALSVTAQVHDPVLGDALIGDASADDGPLPIRALPPGTPGLSGITLLSARAALRQGRFDQAASLAAAVPDADPESVRARVVRATALAQGQAYGEALAQLLIADAAVDPADRHLADLVKLDLARTYYAAGNPLKAIQHYVQVSREGDQWVHAQWERAWAHFQVDDLSGSLSLLYAFKTPYLADRYLPEGDMLRIYAMFLMCKFPSARAELDAFQARYAALLPVLDQRTATLTPQAAWTEAVLHDAGAATTLPDEVWQAYDTDARMADALATSAEITREITTLDRIDQPWATHATGLLTARRDTIAATEGARILTRTRAMRDEVRHMLEGADLTRLDILEYERKLLQRAAITGEVDLGDRVGELRALRRRRGTRLWPSSDEMWADEVGYHSVRTRSDCREDLL